MREGGVGARLLGIVKSEMRVGRTECPASAWRRSCTVGAPVLDGVANRARGRVVCLCAGHADGLTVRCGTAGAQKPQVTSPRKIPNPIRTVLRMCLIEAWRGRITMSTFRRSLGLGAVTLVAPSYRLVWQEPDRHQRPASPVRALGSNCGTSTAPAEPGNAANSPGAPFNETTPGHAGTSTPEMDQARRNMPGARPRCRSMTPPVVDSVRLDPLRSRLTQDARESETPGGDGVSPSVTCLSTRPSVCSRATPGERHEHDRRPQLRPRRDEVVRVCG
jgi:hypothetical protein